MKIKDHQRNKFIIRIHKLSTGHDLLCLPQFISDFTRNLTDLWNIIPTSNTTCFIRNFYRGFSLNLVTQTKKVVSVEGLKNVTSGGCIPCIHRNGVENKKVFSILTVSITTRHWMCCLL